MVDLTMDGSGNINTSGTVTFAVPPPNQDALVRELQEKAKRYARQINELKEALDQALDNQTDTNFTKEELAFILSRVHPDKNPNSKIATSLTSKLIKQRKK